MEQCIHCGETVEFERDNDGDLICPSCGWAQSAVKPNVREAKVYQVEPSKGWARTGALVTLGLGIVSLGAGIGLLDIVLGVAMLRFKEWARQFAVGFGLLQLLLLAIAIPVLFWLMSSEPLLIDVMAERMAGAMAGAILVAPIKIFTVIVLTRPAVRAAFLQ